MMTQRMVVGPTSKAAAMAGNAILRESSSPTSRKPAAARRTAMRPIIRCEAPGTESVWALALGQVASQINSALASGCALGSNSHARAGRQPEAYVAFRAEGRSHEA